MGSARLTLSKTTGREARSKICSGILAQTSVIVAQAQQSLFSNKFDDTRSSWTAIAIPQPIRGTFLQCKEQKTLTDQFLKRKHSLFVKDIFAGRLGERMGSSFWQNENTDTVSPSQGKWPDWFITPTLLKQNIKARRTLTWSSNFSQAQAGKSERAEAGARHWLPKSSPGRSLPETRNQRGHRAHQCPGQE